MESGLMEPTLYSIEAIAILDNDGNRILAKYYGKTFPTAKEQKAFEKNLYKKTHRANTRLSEWLKQSECNRKVYVCSCGWIKTKRMPMYCKCNCVTYACSCGCGRPDRIPSMDCETEVNIAYGPSLKSNMNCAKHKKFLKGKHTDIAEVIMLDGLIVVYRSNVDLFFYVMGSCHENELILVSVLNCLYDAVNQILKKNVERRTLLENLDVILLAIDEICDGGIVLEADSTSVVQRVAVRSDDIPLGEQTVAQVLQSAKEQLKWSLLK